MFEESVWASMTSWLTPAVFFVLLNVVIGTIVFTTTLANKKHHQDSQPDSQHQQKFAGSSPLLQRLKSINFSGSYRSHESPSSLKLHPKKNTDSEPLFNFEHIPQSQKYEKQSQYISSPQNQEKQGSLDENHREMQGHYFFEQNPSEISEERKESYAYQGNHRQESPEIRPHREIKIKENVECRSEKVEEIQRVKEEEEEEVYSQPTEHHIFRSNSDTKPAAGEIPKKLPAKMKKSASLKSAFNHFEAEDILEARRPATVKEKSSKAADVDNEVDAKADDFINKFKQQLKLQRLDSIIRYKEMIGKGKGGGG